MSKKRIALYNAIPTGIFIILLSFFIADGGLGENYTGNRFVNPQVFWAILVWFLCYLVARNEKLFVMGLISMYAIPVVSVFILW